MATNPKAATSSAPFLATAAAWDTRRTQELSTTRAGAEALTMARAGGPGATTVVLRDVSAWQDFTTGSCTPVNN